MYDDIFCSGGFQPRAKYVRLQAATCLKLFQKPSNVRLRSTKALPARADQRVQSERAKKKGRPKDGGSVLAAGFVARRTPQERLSFLV